jgi:DNA-binding NarL/FixJ family response regulator
MAKRSRILIADDHALIRHGLRDILERCLPKVIIGEAETGIAALEFVHNATWDVVVLDIVMPGRSGLEVLSEMIGLNPAPPVLMLSMHAEEQYARRVMKMGASGYITKIKAALAIVEAVKCILAGGRYFNPALNDQEIELAAPGGRNVPRAELSRREVQVLRQITTGKSQKQIAADLAVSTQTVSTHRARILRKLGRHTTADLIRYALENGFAD